MTMKQIKRTRQLQQDADRALYTWQSPIALATACGKTRITIYRWIKTRRVQVRRLSARSLLVRLPVPRTNQPRS